MRICGFERQPAVGADAATLGAPAPLNGAFRKSKNRVIQCGLEINTSVQVAVNMLAPVVDFMSGLVVALMLAPVAACMWALAVDFM